LCGGSIEKKAALIIARSQLSTASGQLFSFHLLNELKDNQ
jgi:hypothetical protein